jgi:tRNA 2-thiouridine synthesizing protein C
MTKQRILYVFTTGPYTNAAGQEGLDAVMIGAAFDLDVSLLFVHDGLHQLKLGQQANAGIKQVTKAFRALQDFGVENIYAFDSSMLARGLSTDQLMLDVELLDSRGVAQLIKQQHKVFTF